MASLESCRSKLRFRTAVDLRQLYTLLEIPDMCNLGPWAAFIRGEHIFLIFIQRMALAQRVKELIVDFGYTKGKWSVAFRWMAKFIYKHRLSRYACCWRI